VEDRKSPDMTQLDFYLWRRMKILVSATESQTVAELTGHILDATGQIAIFSRATSFILKSAKTCLRWGLL